MGTITLDNGNTLVPGTISEGTLHPRDLTLRFLAVLRIVAPAEYEALTFNSGFNCPPNYAREDRASSWWDSDQARYLLEEITETLEAHAPEGYWFGAHPGDGADFGYWPLDLL